MRSRIWSAFASKRFFWAWSRPSIHATLRPWQYPRRISRPKPLYSTYWDNIQKWSIWPYCLLVSTESYASTQKRELLMHIWGCWSYPLSCSFFYSCHDCLVEEEGHTAFFWKRSIYHCTEWAQLTIFAWEHHWKRRSAFLSQGTAPIPIDPIKQAIWGKSSNLWPRKSYCDRDWQWTRSWQSGAFSQNCKHEQISRHRWKWPTECMICRSTKRVSFLLRMNDTRRRKHSLQPSRHHHHTDRDTHAWREWNTCSHRLAHDLRYQRDSTMGALTEHPCDHPQSSQSLYAAEIRRISLDPFSRSTRRDTWVALFSHERRWWAKWNMGQIKASTEKNLYPMKGWPKTIKPAYVFFDRKSHKNTKRAKIAWNICKIKINMM